MIVTGIEYNKLPTMISVTMAASPDFTFYLTGSRFWGTAKDNSDWDLFVEDSDEIRNWLFQMGFCSHRNRYAGDKECSGVLEYVSSVGHVIQVQLVRNILKKRKAQFILRRMFPEGFFKSGASFDEPTSARIWWSRIYMILDHLQSFNEEVMIDTIP